MTRKRKAGRPPLGARKKSRKLFFKVTSAFAKKIERSAKAHGLSITNELYDRLDAGESEEAWELTFDLVAVIRMVGGWQQRDIEEKQALRETEIRIDAHEAKKKLQLKKSEHDPDFGPVRDTHTARSFVETVDQKTEAQKIRDAVRIVVDAHTEKHLPDDLLESKRYGLIEARMAAWQVLSRRKFGRGELPGLGEIS